VANLELEGMENLLTEVEKLGQAGSRIENKALREAGEVVKEAVKQAAPRRTGTLRASIAVSNVKTKDGVKHVEVGPGKEGWYGKFLEFGTVKMKAQPFMAPGYENSKNQAMATIERELKKGLGL
jgi:HK97 gp10 family phage protein